MRIALIADIHGNTVALDAVLGDLERREADMIVCLGDIAAGGPDPGGAVDRIAAGGCIAVQGNTDAGVVDVPGWWRQPQASGLPAAAVPGLETCVWGAGRLSEEQRRFLAGLPTTVKVTLGAAGELLAFHGSPRSADDLITAETPTAELDVMVAGSETMEVLAGGHTHVPLVRRHRKQTVVNPGSVGMPFAEYGYAGGVAVLSHAAYAILEVEDGEMAIELRQVPVDREALELSVAQSDMPKGDWWLGLRSRSD